MKLSRSRITLLATGPLMVAGALLTTAFTSAHTAAPTMTKTAATASIAPATSGGKIKAADKPEQAGAETPDAPEQAGAEVPDAPEKAGGVADGPGGHTDPPGANVDHEFSGAE